MRIFSLVTPAVALMLAACSADLDSGATDAPAAKPPAVAARLATETTFRHAANDAAIWIDGQDPAKSILLVSGVKGDSRSMSSPVGALRGSKRWKRDSSIFGATCRGRTAPSTW